MRTGIANAFLIGFIESMADLGNPLVLGGDYPVLSTEIFFAVAGATVDTGKAAALAIVLLMFTLTAFLIQNKWVGKKSYATVTGKGDAGVHTQLPTSIRWISLSVASVWSIFTVGIYLMVLFGGFVENWGVDHTFTIKHYVDSFGVTFAAHGIDLDGFAWDSFFDTMVLAMIAAPITAVIGMLIGYLLSRQNFAGKPLFEFATMLSFAIPGIVIGIAYIIAFNQPPIELTFTGSIIVLSFVFRNMPVGIRASVAAMAQLDKNMDEAALTLGANRLTCIRTIIIPLLKPAIIAALIYSFIRAITSISAVIFLVSAEYNLATTYIIGLVEGALYGSAIAYSSVLIVVMLLAILIIQKAVGKRKLYRSDQN
jgi:iron(III) transport system permease protein